MSTDPNRHAHHYTARLSWVGAAQGTTLDYESYSREWIAETPGKPRFHGSADQAFRGDPDLDNPEDLLVVALSSCHMLSYLAICSRKGIEVVSYVDEAIGTMDMRDGKLRFTEVVLRPAVTVARAEDVEKALRQHHGAHEQCFIANSVNFPVRHEATVTAAGAPV